MYSLYCVGVFMISTFAPPYTYMYSIYSIYSAVAVRK